LFQPCPFGAGDVEAVIVGGVVAMLTLMLVVAVFPATSVTVPLINWLAPCVLTVSGCGQIAIGAVVAVQVKVTVTLELFQPAAFAAGEATTVIVGGVVAMLTVALAVVEFPAMSVAVPVTI